MTKLILVGIVMISFIVGNIVEAKPTKCPKIPIKCLEPGKCKPIRCK